MPCSLLSTDPTTCNCDCNYSCSSSPAGFAKQTNEKDTQKEKTKQFVLSSYHNINIHRLLA